MSHPYRIRMPYSHGSHKTSDRTPCKFQIIIFERHLTYMYSDLPKERQIFTPCGYVYLVKSPASQTPTTVSNNVGIVTGVESQEAAEQPFLKRTAPSEIGWKSEHVCWIVEILLGVLVGEYHFEVISTESARGAVLIEKWSLW